MEERARRDLTVLVGVIGVIAASMALQPSTEALTVFGWELPPLCAFRATTGYRCPGCGLTRSFVFLGHADLAAAFAQNPLGPMLWVFFLAQVPYRALRLWRARREGALPVRHPGD